MRNYVIITFPNKISDISKNLSLKLKLYDCWNALSITLKTEDICECPIRRAATPTACIEEGSSVGLYFENPNSSSSKSK